MKILRVVTSLNTFFDDLEEKVKRLKERHVKKEKKITNQVVKPNHCSI